MTPRSSGPRQSAEAAFALRHGRSTVSAKRITGTREWAEVTANCMDGCANDCRYCYAKTMSIRFGRRTPETWSDEVPRLDRIELACTGRPRRVMFPSTHDITSSSLPYCVEAIRRLLEHGHSLLVVSKPRVDCIQAICHEFNDQREMLMFRFTIGSADDGVLSFWEPNAPSFMERLDSLCYAYEQGFQTSVSCEPMLDTNIGKVVTVIDPYVSDAIWIGKANMLRQRLKVNGASDAETSGRCDELLADQCDERIFDLYNRLRANPKVKWKDSIKKVVGIDAPERAGMDI